MTEVLRIDNLWVEGRQPSGRYASIVKGVSLTVNAGEVVALIGESGSGKTTSALAALCYTRPGCRIANGHIALRGIDLLALDSESRRQLRGRKVSFVAQSAMAAFNPALSIDEQVTEGLHIHRLMSRDKALIQARELYLKLGLPDADRIGLRYPHQVSGGQLQRLLAAMAMSCGPDLIVFDEPTTALDVTTQIEVLSAFKEIVSQRQTAALYVSHDLAVVAQIADRIVVLYRGEVVEEGPTDQILKSASHAYTRSLLEAVKPPPLVTHRGSSGVVEHAAPGTSVIDVSGITAAYGRSDARTTVLRDVSMSVQRGEVVGVIGESGCGKSTLARAIAGLLPPVSGQIKLADVVLAPVVRGRSKEELRRIQIVFQMPDVALNPRQTVAGILNRPLEFYMGMNGDARMARVRELMDMMELPGSFVSRYPGELSGGQKQRVNLARAMAARPDIILCDEVTSSLDTLVAASILRLLTRLRESLGLSYVFISHDLSTVASFANKIVVLYAGRVVEQGPTASVLAPPYHPYTRLLLASVPKLRKGWLEDIVRSREATAGIAREVKLVETGCPFFNRCPMALPGLCDREDPPLLTLSTQQHVIACHRTASDLATELASY